MIWLFRSQVGRHRRSIPLSCAHRRLFVLIAVTAQVTEATGMAFREVSVNEITEVLRVWLGVAGLPAPGYRTIAAHCGVHRKTVRRYVEAAQAAGRGEDGAATMVSTDLKRNVASVQPWLGVRPDTASSASAIASSGFAAHSLTASSRAAHR